MAKPKLVLHPGFPKCGSSAIQRMFVVEGHCLGRALGVGVIGRNCQANSGYPDVSKLMYSPKDYLADLSETNYEDGVYFLSNEALQGNTRAIQVIAEKFDVEVVVFTIRCPIIQAVSNYRYSGWLENNFADFLANSKSAPSAVASRMRRKIDGLGDYFDNLRLCALEGTSRPFEERFLRMSFGWSPPWLGDSVLVGGEVVNKSIGIAFAEACYIERELRNIKVSGFERNALVKAAQTYPLPERLAKLTIASAVEALTAAWRGGVDDYFEILREYGVLSREAGEVLHGAERHLDRLTSMPVADAEDMAELREHAGVMMDEYRRTSCQN